MATMQIGIYGTPFDTEPYVLMENDEQTVRIMCRRESRTNGDLIELKMTRDEAMVLLADLADGLAGRFIPPKEFQKLTPKPVSR